jgi:small subunit ribosomal protein S6
MRLYETGFLIAPNITDEEAEAIIQQMAEIVSQKNGKMIKLDKWGKRRTAYALKKFNEAAYVFFHYEGGPDIPLELARRFRQMDTILRYLTVVKETQPNVRKKKKAAGRTRAKESAFEEPAEDQAAKSEGATAPAKTGEEVSHG